MTTERTHLFIGKGYCPACHRRGLHYVTRPRDSKIEPCDRVVCRFCQARFRVKPKGVPPRQHEVKP